MRHPVITLTLLLGGMVCGGGARADDEAEHEGWFQSERPRWRQNLFKRVLDDQRFLVTTWWPAEARRPSFSAPLLLASLAAAGSSRNNGEDGLDARLEDAISGNAHGNGLVGARALTNLGDGPSAALLLGGTYLISRWTGHEGGEEASSLAAEALLDTTIYTTTLKVLTRRARPSRGEGEFFQSGRETDNDSFPSGHAAGAFAVATVFAERFHEKRWVPWVAYGTAGLIGASRIELGRHFPSDVLFGAVLGHSMGQMVMTRARGEEARYWGRIEPIVDPGSGAYGIAYRKEW